ncbi:MAG: 16S rRNA (adenine(1518)-N(6)/adenine(1519)-N(6))-dimethyltransferase RsmA [Bacteroidetes bacterium]|nr:16S rRNA (adenine(1518)-N(6)/adenine(1519)-N(6))-dimethyltransferase RsmA [Bacteroidota bacterium]MBL7103893.1 16S rRNA (adenine(1518)-N(6)/adenine(1519)-N(6))-dimethyltransferase RsmA [Bacteroidales bacterium]
MVFPKKHLGQHFLKDANIARKIVSSFSPETENVLEIGPGKGILTKYLISKFKNLYIIEIDEESVKYLKHLFPDFSGRIIEGDFLKYDLNTIFMGRFSVIGNFPYNISSQILFKILEYRNRVDEVVGMFQKEVAERISSPPGNKKYGILSVLIQAFYDIELMFTVNENVFQPPPKVKSTVIRLKRNKTAKLNCDEPLFFDLIKTAFNQRRKTLRNSLSKYHLTETDRVKSLFTKRAEQLNVMDFEYLTQRTTPA